MALAETEAPAPTPRFACEKTSQEKATGLIGTAGVGDPAWFCARLACAMGGVAVGARSGG
jgi:hypothetical protein